MTPMISMTPDRLFSIVNTAALVAWLPLIFVPRARWTRAVPFVAPALLAVVYVALLTGALPHSEGNFSSLAGVRALFADPWALVAGWTHYLAFDLFVGGWEVRDAQRRGVPHLLVVPALVLTFLVGPGGLLLYLAIRSFVPASWYARSETRAVSPSPPASPADAGAVSSSPSRS